MPFPAVKCSIFIGIFGEYDNSCTGEGMPSPYNKKQNLTDKSEFEKGRTELSAPIFYFLRFFFALRMAMMRFISLKTIM